VKVGGDGRCWGSGFYPWGYGFNHRHCHARQQNYWVLSKIVEANHGLLLPESSFHADQAGGHQDIGLGRQRAFRLDHSIPGLAGTTDPAHDLSRDDQTMTWWQHHSLYEPHMGMSFATRANKIPVLLTTAQYTIAEGDPAVAVSEESHPQDTRSSANIGHNDGDLE
jgi:hypothetical protein